MKIETKFNIGDTVYFIKDYKIKKDKIARIQANIFKKDIEVIYVIDDLSNTKIYEDYVFINKEDLVNFYAKSIA